jgi:hypothetical protein
MSTLLRPAVIILFILGIISGCVYLSNFQLGYLVQHVFPDLTSMHLFVIQFLFLHVIYLSSLYLVFKKLDNRRRGPKLLVILFLFGVFFRLCLVGSTPVLSSDIYRYVWDGRVQSQGINPYMHPPSAESLAPLRDSKIYPQINRPSSPTIYPPGAQIYFLLSHWLAGDSVVGTKVILVFFDVLTMALLLSLLKSYKLPLTRFIVYGWNPLVIVEIANSGHLEGFVVFLVVLALYFHCSTKKNAGVLSLAGATATKIYPALLLPCLINRGARVKRMSIFFLALLLLYVPYVAAGKKVLGFLPTYFKSPYESFNLGLKYFLMHIFPDVDYLHLTKIFAGILLIALLIVLYLPKGKEKIIKYSFILITLQLLLMPAALHPWYVVWLIPLLAFYPSPAWLIFSGTVVLSYLKYVSTTGAMPTWILCVEYLPLFALLLLEYLWSKGRLPWRSGGRVARTT